MKYFLKILILCLFPLLALGQQTESKFAPLLTAAKKSHSSALILIQDGEKVIEYYNGSEKGKIESMSVTKSIVALAIARLLTENKIDSLNTPVAHYYPEWRQGQKKTITIRHLMNHTSGLQNVLNSTVEIQPSSNFIQLALCASVVDKPGTEFAYNNKAVNLLAGIIQKASGQQMDDYLRNGLFKEMGITDFNWRTDDAGNPRAMAGFQVYPADLAKIGQLVLNKGRWKGKQLIAEKWVDELLAQSQPFTETYGLLWWRVPSKSRYIIDEKHIQDLKKAGLRKEFLIKIANIKGVYESKNAIVQALFNQFDKREIGKLKQALSRKKVSLWKSEIGPIVGYEAEGYLGQYLVIFPEQNIVAVRMIKNSENYNRKTDGFGNFAHKVYNLATK